MSSLFSFCINASVTHLAGVNSKRIVEHESGRSTPAVDHAIYTGVAMPEKPDAFDLVVIGGGPAGIIGATTAAAFGKKVVLVDNHPELGGAGANTGTVPSKTLRETALAFSGMKSRNLYGVDLSLRREATVADFLRHERNVKTGLNHSLSQRLDACHTTVYSGTAGFEDPHTLRVQRESGPEFAENPPDLFLKSEHFLIATGSSPVHPPGFPFGSNEVYDSDTILNLDRLPETMAVIGCGTIGSEYACTFAALGTRVHLIDGRDVLLSFLDREIARALLTAMERNGVIFHWKELVKTLRTVAIGQGKSQLSSGETPLKVDAVLIAFLPEKQRRESESRCCRRNHRGARHHPR